MYGKVNGDFGFEYAEQAAKRAQSIRPNETWCPLPHVQITVAVTHTFYQTTPHSFSRRVAPAVNLLFIINLLLVLLQNKGCYLLHDLPHYIIRTSNLCCGNVLIVDQLLMCSPCTFWLLAFDFWPSLSSHARCTARCSLLARVFICVLLLRATSFFCVKEKNRAEIP